MPHEDLRGDDVVNEVTVSALDFRGDALREVVVYS
jgi:hypothetical protein